MNFTSNRKIPFTYLRDVTDKQRCLSDNKQKTATCSDISVNWNWNWNCTKGKELE